MRLKLFVLSLFCILSFHSSNAQKVVHVIVALCDNESQGIVPVSKTLGDGNNPFTNLYWGAAYGVKTYFKRKSGWKLISTTKVNNTILERCIFEHTATKSILITDAYRGNEIKTAISNFINSSAGELDETITVGENKQSINLKDANVVCYVGHNGLMEFDISKDLSDSKSEKNIMILACAAKPYFSKYFEKTSIYPLLWTTNLMAPEAYTLEASLTAWINGKSKSEIRLAGAAAYNKYQKCGINGAKRLLVSGY